MKFALSRNLVLCTLVLLALLTLFTTPTLAQSVHVTTVAWSPNGAYLAEGYTNGTVIIRNASTNQVVHTLTGHTQAVYIVAWSPIQSANRLASAGPDLSIRIWDTNTGGLIRTLTGHQMRIFTLIWSLDGTKIISGALSNDSPSEFRAWDAATGNSLHNVHLGDLHDLRWNSIGTQLALATLGGVGIVDGVTLQLVTRIDYPELSGEGFDSYKIAWHPNDRLIVSGSLNSTIRVWDTVTGQITLTIAGENILGLDAPHPTTVVAITFNGDGSQITGLRADGKLRTWNASTGQLLGELQLAVNGIIYDAAFSPDKTRIAYGDASGTTQIAPTTTARVTTNLLALYTFEEGSGTTVSDVSGVGTAVNLVIGSPTNASVWGAGYLRFTGGAQGTNSAFAPAGTNKLPTALKAANAVTVEAWVTPANVTQQGPARVVTFSSSIWTRNFTIGQSLTQYDFRLRTTTTDSNGVPGTLTPSNTAAVGLQHIVTTRDAAGLVTIYVNGVSVATSTRTGDFSGWDNAMRFGVGNELSLDRPWRGDVHLVAVYDRALSAAEVTQNYNAGSGDGQSSFAPENVVVMPDDSALEEVVSAAPVANAGANITVTDSDGDGVETVKLDASASTDDVGIVEVLWGDATSDEPAAHGIEASLTLAVGTHEVLLIVVDGDGQVGMDRVVVRFLTP